jgi:hypothetical protein
MNLTIHITHPKTQIPDLVQIIQTRFELNDQSQLKYSGMIEQTKAFNAKTLKLLLEVKCRKAHKIVCELTDHIQFYFDNQTLVIQKLEA